MENNLENKAKLFAQYWGQKVFINALNKAFFIQKVGSSYMTKYGVEHRCIYLKPLSSITDEVAEMVSGLMHWGKDPKSVRNTIVLLNLNSFPAIVIDYLRSKGYAVPFLGMSVEQLVDFGWIKLEVPNA